MKTLIALLTCASAAYLSLSAADTALSYEPSALLLCYVATTPSGDTYIIGSGYGAQAAMQNAVWPSATVMAVLVECDTL